MLFVVLTAILVLLSLLPQLWIRLVMRRHGEPLATIPGTGAEFAGHLIKRFELPDVRVEQAQAHGDHFDPIARAVRLSPSNFSGRSLTALCVAAHEVGHAIQCVRREPIFDLRRRYLPIAVRLKKAGVYLIAAAPFLLLIFRTPSAVITLVVVSIVLQIAGALTYLIVLPEEWDASYNKALVMLTDGKYITQDQVGPARQVLGAAALTYFAGALADVVNIGRWLLLLRR